MNQNSNCYMSSQKEFMRFHLCYAGYEIHPGIRHIFCVSGIGFRPNALSRPLVSSLFQLYLSLSHNGMPTYRY